QLLAGLGAAAFVLSQFGANVTVATLTPCAGYANSRLGHACGSSPDDSPASCTAASGSTATSVDNNRDAVNLFLCGGSLPAPGGCVAALDTAVSNGAAPEKLLAGDDAGDHVNLSPAGYTAAATAADGDCPLSTG